MKRIRIESPLFVLHKLAICDFTEWVNESALRRAPLSVEDPETKNQTFLIPDAGFTLLSQTTGRKADFFLEMDLATVSLKAIRQRLRGYLFRKDLLAISKNETLF